MTRKFSDEQQFEKAVFYYASKLNDLYRTKLNKLLFYTQFYHQKRFNKAYFSSFVFIKDTFGPVLVNLDAHLNMLATRGAITIEPDIYGNIVKAAEGRKLAKGICLPDEIVVFEKILDKFRNFSSRDLSDYSHKEPLWKNTRFKGEIAVGRSNELLDL